MGILRRFFWLLNKFFMVPMFRLGFGPVFGNPFSGYVMVLRTVGRKTGRTRYTPVTYALANGCVYCLAGFGRISDWYRNVQAAPDIALILPAGAVAGRVEEVEDPAERLVVTRQIFKNAGFVGLLEGFNPFRASDETIAAKTAEMPVLRIRPTGVASGPCDPGGWAWIWGPVLTIAAIAAAILLIG
jgi:deazaflavin-dependent oxidoreductase (nitroreductase family)